MQSVTLRHAFDGAQLMAFGFDGEHQAGTDQAIVQHDAARAAIAGRAAFLRAGQAERPAQRIEHGVTGLAQKLRRLAIDGGGNVQFCHVVNFLARALTAIATVRFE